MFHCGPRITGKYAALYRGSKCGPHIQSDMVSFLHLNNSVLTNSIITNSVMTKSVITDKFLLQIGQFIAQFNQVTMKPDFNVVSARARCLYSLQLLSECFFFVSKLFSRQNFEMSQKHLVLLDDSIIFYLTCLSTHISDNSLMRQQEYWLKSEKNCHLNFSIFQWKKCAKVRKNIFLFLNFISKMLL